MPEKRSIKDLIDGLVDKDGIKTEVTVTLTRETTTKIIIALLVSGASILGIVYLTKHLFPNRQLSALQADLNKIKQTLINK